MVTFFLGGGWLLLGEAVDATAASEEMACVEDVDQGYSSETGIT
ncbi:hypothetical protein [Arthrobacter sp. ok909]|nr:hypothetical protein [Arthrobacter sp. ok909]